jgi:hypothetical protein
MAETKITRDQMKRLQTLWGQYARHELLPNTREERLRWAASQFKYTGGLSSFKELTLVDASFLINQLQSLLGIKETSPSARPRRYRSRIKDKDQAHAAGTEGRRGQRDKLTIATAEDLALIETQLQMMDWTRARLGALLNSSSSPLGRRSNPQLRTVADVNRVLWALKRIARKKVKAEAQA